MSFVVVIKPKARRDIHKEERDLMRERDSRAVRKWQAQVLRFRTLLASDPHRCPQADEADNLALDLRELVLGRKRGIAHRVLFTIEGDSVVVHRIRQSARDRITEDDL